MPGKSLYEPDQVDAVKQLRRGWNIAVPSDVRVAVEFSETALAGHRPVTDIRNDEQIVDIGNETARQYAHVIQEAATIFWYGPVGFIEFPNFRQGTEAVARAVAANKAFSVAVGGDTAAAIDMFGVADKISHISRGGTATFVEYAAGRQLPGIAALRSTRQAGANQRQPGHHTARRSVRPLSRRHARRQYRAFGRCRNAFGR